ncbi:hypothetical protein Trco_003480 [Trichoderma cornu-damae]|uniref:Wbp11/ELF5/Saf1 N-terminal domain-containing protein n=1 Tax=Trichoderma cornu-damae TaxID=654480 RepID=A0A9P8QRG8_9HYPO|nr:hypothetical protein Trco_003480 [Trichoderma cornu-damae]
MPKEKNYNPVQAQRKADKAREIKKGKKHGRNFVLTEPVAGKAEAQSRRNEKLARKNPDRIQKQIDDLKAIAAGGGKLTRHEEQVLEGLERELGAVRKARDTLGDDAPGFGGRGRRRDDHGPRSGALGKRRRGDGGDGSSSGEDVAEDVRSIPMPRDTPPPIPKAELDKWYAKRRARRAAENAARRADGAGGGEAGGGRDGDGDGDEGKGKGGERGRNKAPPAVESKTVYEAKPVVRDLRKEAVSAFVPTSVQMKMNKGKGQGGLMEPEEADRLERDGYLKLASGGGRDEAEEDAGAEAGAAAGAKGVGASSRHVMMEEVQDEEA